MICKTGLWPFLQWNWLWWGKNRAHLYVISVLPNMSESIPSSCPHNMHRNNLLILYWGHVRLSHYSLSNSWQRALKKTGSVFSRLLSTQAFCSTWHLFSGLHIIADTIIPKEPLKRKGSVQFKCEAKETKHEIFGTKTAIRPNNMVMAKWAFLILLIKIKIDLKYFWKEIWLY